MLSSIYRSSLFLGDIILVNISCIIALLLRFDFAIPTQYWNLYLDTFIVLTLINIGVNLLFRLYKCILQYTSIRDIIYIFTSNIISTILFFTYSYFIHNTFPLSIYIIYLCILMLGMFGSRISFRIAAKFYQAFRTELLPKFQKEPQKTLTRTMLIGAGEAASIIIKDSKALNINSHIVLAVDDSKLKQSGSIMGVPIKGTLDDIPNLVDTYDIEEILIAIPSASKKRISEIIQLCSNSCCTLKIFPGIKGSLTSSLLPIRNVVIEDLLGRDEITLDNHEVSSHISAKTILVTGGGGSIGSELCRQIASFKPDTLIIFDIYENNAYDIQNELLLNGLNPNSLKTIIGSVRDKAKLKDVFRKYSPDIVFHAAAHKHVPLMEESPEEAVKNNVFGTLNVALCAKNHRTSKFILISTDKAVNPTNVMGATKRICEMIIQSINNTTPHTDYVAVRFGNVLGSNGSVLPLFRRQLESGGPLTVTHPDIIRYFMTIPEAVRLILQAMTFATGGEIFVLDMGDPVKIYDLAQNFIKLSGLEPHKDIDIIFSGLRPGEKLYEELLMSEEGLLNTASNKIFIGQPATIDFSTLLTDLDNLSLCLYDKALIRKELSRIVPTYQTPEKANLVIPLLTQTKRTNTSSTSKAV